MVGVAVLVCLLGSARAIIFTLPSSEDVCFGEEVGIGSNDCDPAVTNTYCHRSWATTWLCTAHTRVSAFQ